MPKTWLKKSIVKVLLARANSGSFPTTNGHILSFLHYIQGKPSDKYCLQRFNIILAQKCVTKKTKNFYACNKFFRTVVYVYVIALCIHHIRLNKIDDFKTWLSNNNWTKLLASIEQKFLGVEEVQKIQ